MRADRLLTIMLTLQTRGKMTTETLAETLEVSRRTILRDINALTTAGVPIYTESGQGGGVYLDEHYRVSLTGLKEPEIRSLFVSTLPGPLADLGLAEATETSLLKLLARLPRVQRAVVEQTRQRLHLDPTGWWPNPDSTSFLADLLRAVENDLRIETVYERGDGTISRQILEPYSLVAKANVWYLVAKRAREFRTYRVGQFETITVLDEVFEREASFDLAAYWSEHSSRFMMSRPEYPFILRMQADRLLFLKWFVYDPYEVIEPANPEGWLKVAFRLGSLDAARMLVMGLGNAATVLEPLELKQAVLTTAQQIVAHYDEIVIE